MRDLCMRLGEKLVERDFHIVCGMGLNVGDAVVKGALVRMFELGETRIERRLSLSPFPRNLPDNVSEAVFNRGYREAMIGKSGIAIFVAGTSRTAPESRGVLEEYEIVRKMQKIPIPIGVTGFAARRIWEAINSELQTFYDGTVSQDLFDQLNNPALSNEQLVNAVFDVVAKVEQSFTTPSPASLARTAQFNVSL